MKIKLNLDDELPLNETIEIPTMTIVVGAIFVKITNFNNDCLYKLEII